MRITKERRQTFEKMKNKIIIMSIIVFVCCLLISSNVLGDFTIYSDDVSNAKKSGKVVPHIQNDNGLDYIMICRQPNASYNATLSKRDAEQPYYWYEGHDASDYNSGYYYNGTFYKSNYKWDGTRYCMVYSQQSLNLKTHQDIGYIGAYGSFRNLMYTDEVSKAVAGSSVGNGRKR